MAFEGINNGEFKTYLTKYGMRKLLNNNLSIKYFSLRDEGINYSLMIVMVMNTEILTQLYTWVTI